MVSLDSSASVSSRRILLVFGEGSVFSLISSIADESSGRIPDSFKSSISSSGSSSSSLISKFNPYRQGAGGQWIDGVDLFNGVRWPSFKLTGECVSQSNHCSSPVSRPGALFKFSSGCSRLKCRKWELNHFNSQELTLAGDRVDLQMPQTLSHRSLNARALHSSSDKNL